MTYRILINSKVPRKTEFTSLQLSTRDLAISSIALNESVITLRIFLKRCLLISEEEQHHLMVKPAQVKGDVIICWEDGNILFFATELNWRTLNILYALYSTPKVTTELYHSITSFNESRSMEMALYNKTLEDFKIQLTNHTFNFYSEQILYFNAQRLMREGEKLNINTSIVEDKVLFRYKDVEYASKEGSIFYNEIFIFIKDFKIDGFMFRFKDFDFSSYWNIPIVLHPFLAVPYGFNEHLSFLPPQNYQAFAEGLHSMITGDIKGGFKKIPDLIRDFQDLKRIWAGNKMNARERIELSKLILDKKFILDKDE